jgi:hypothetical protein
LIEINIPVMPDLIRHPELQCLKNWIPGQARNDEWCNECLFANFDTVSSAGMTRRSATGKIYFD